jgi:hypothetical protein|tara:strand:- start:1784 stop:2539 length:756 start_codon:yes stop_codon:yes gene_type:complete
MARSNYFQNYEASGEQRLLESLVIEAISIYGQEAYFLPRTVVNSDQLFSEDTVSQFAGAYPLEMYIKDVEGFAGEGDFLTRFGLEIRDQVTLSMARRRFEEEVTEWDTSITRPREGDLIYLPWIKGSLPNAKGALFEIKFVEHDTPFYQLGNLYMYDISCERFEYSDERLDTGLATIDNIEVDESQSYALTAANLSTEAGAIIALENGEYLINDNYSKRLVDKDDDSDFFQGGASGFIDFSEVNPFSENLF